MTVAVANPNPMLTVSVAEVDLKFMWDLISRIKVGESGHVYVVDTEGRLIADPDITSVLRNTNLSRLVHVHAAEAARTGEAASWTPDKIVTDGNGRSVLAAYAPVEPAGWFVFVELPVAEAFAPVYARIWRAILLLAMCAGIALIVGLFLTRKIIRPMGGYRNSQQTYPRPRTIVCVSITRVATRLGN